MSNSMFLLEVRNSSNEVFKRRITDNLCAVEDWIEHNAQKWAVLPVQVEHNGYGGGEVYLANSRNSVVFTYTSTAIGII